MGNWDAASVKRADVRRAEQHRRFITELTPQEPTPSIVDASPNFNEMRQRLKKQTNNNIPPFSPGPFETHANFFEHLAKSTKSFYL